MNFFHILQFFWPHIKPFKWHYAVMLTAPLLASFYPLAFSYAVKLFIDAMTVTNNVSYKNLMVPISLILGGNIAMLLIWRISDIAEWRAEPFVRRSILLQSYGKVQNYSYSFFQNNFTGAISSKIKGILDGYDTFWAEMHHGLLYKTLIACACIIGLWVINPLVGSLLLVWGILFATLMSLLSKKLNILANKEADIRHDLIGQVSDKISNIFCIFSFAAKKSELQALDKKACRDFIPAQQNLYKCSFFLHIVGGILYTFMFAALMVLMIHLRKKNQVSLGDFAFVFSTTFTAADAIWNLTHALQDFSRSMGNLLSALKLMHEPPANLVEPAKAIPRKSLGAKVEFQNLHFSYVPPKEVFSELNLTINPGEKVGLVGHSGAGKSTLVNLLLKFFSPTLGKILFNGEDTSLFNADSLRNEIALIPQDVQLFNRSLRENIRFAKPQASNEELYAAAKKAHIHDFIVSQPLGYDSLVGERGIKLSGGQRQRIAIARAILKDAPMLILDEATSSLDSQTEYFIQNSLNKLMKDDKKTVLAIAHRLSTLNHMDRIIVLDEGRIVQEGSHQELIQDKSGHYFSLWNHQKLVD